jgi:hypothetical protein
LVPFDPGFCRHRLRSVRHPISEERKPMSIEELNDWKIREYDRLRVENAGLLQANRDCCAWFDSLLIDHQKALKALDELARLGNGTSYGDSTGNVIAQDALASMID